MVSQTTIGTMFVPIVFSIVLFIGLILFYRKRPGIAIKPLILGSVGFIVFTQVLEKILHVIVLSNFPNYAEYPIWFGIYGGLTAGVFEELGRFLMFAWLLKKYQDYKGGVSFGIGWGGIEAVVLMLGMMLPNIIFAILINAGTFETTLGGQIPADQLTAIKEFVLSTGTSYYLLAAVERFFTVFLQIALSLAVLLGVMKKKFSYVIYAILIHAAIDFPVALYQVGMIKGIWIIELYIAFFGIMAMLFVAKSRKVFEDMETLKNQ